VNLADLPPLPPDPLVTVMMPVRDEAAHIAAALQSVIDQDHPSDRLEIVVSDGCSTDATREIVAEHAARQGAPAIRLIDNPRRYRASALNEAIRVARGDLLVPVDGHSAIPPDFVRRLVEVSRQTGAACVGGRVITIGVDDVSRAIAAAQASRFGAGGAAFRVADEAGPVDTVQFGAYRREVFDVLGDFDEALLKTEDDEYNLRLQLAGGVIWLDPSITFEHHSRESYGALWRQYHDYGFFKPGVMRKHRKVVSVRHLVPPAFVVGLAGSVVAAAVTRRPALALAVAGPYAAATAANAVRTARATGAPAREVAAATTVLHLSYGVGLLRGLLARPAAPDELAQDEGAASTSNV
jgi:glycosyltransferase involved in cell wall biosynthesis